MPPGLHSTSFCGHVLHNSGVYRNGARVYICTCGVVENSANENVTSVRQQILLRFRVSPFAPNWIKIISNVFMPRLLNCARTSKGTGVQCKHDSKTNCSIYFNSHENMWMVKINVWKSFKSPEMSRWKLMCFVYIFVVKTDGGLLQVGHG